MPGVTSRGIESLRRKLTDKLAQRHGKGDKLAGLAWAAFVEGPVGHEAFPGVVEKYGADPAALVDSLLRDADRIVEAVLRNA